MIAQKEIDFIKEYILKKDEQLDLLKNVPKDASFIDIPIIKKTKRTLRCTGLLMMALYHNYKQIEPDEELKKARITPYKKMNFDDHDPQIVQWFQKGWIIKEIRFKKDGKTAESQHYRMGFRLYQYEQELVKAEEEKVEKDFKQWKLRLKFLSEKQIQFQTAERAKGVRTLLESLQQIGRLKAANLIESSFFPQKWILPKRIKFLEFLLAFLEICISKVAFDWKEIGAVYFKKIGGSKQFDSYKDEFIEQLENLSQCPAVVFGLTSLGKITPLYFSGAMNGKYSSYQYGTVHALTDLSISQEQYSTSADTLWLVENRAVLTRIASEKDFLKDTNSLIICIDGHLRSSHKKCIWQLLKNSSLSQILIWTDYDPDGMQIAAEIYQTVEDAGINIRLKWITMDQHILESWEEYVDNMETFLQNNRIEQEEVLGGVHDWKKWILH